VPILGDDWRFCPRCGATLERRVRGGMDRPSCPACGFVFFANMGVGAAVVVADDAGRVLLVQRGPGHYGAGLWCLPCGYVEWDEDVREAAAREALEEAGVTVEIGEVVQVTVNRHEPDRPTVGIWFAARLLEPGAAAAPGDDAVAVGWFDPATPPPLAFPTDAPLLARLVGRRSEP
jgi:ADP-ribose pyrophosphatase YjhB (NUDIX family)